MARSFVAPTYMPAADLHQRLVDPDQAAKTLVVDVRDEDFVGGNVKGGVNYPSEEFLDSLDEVAKAAEGKEVVVFHCMQSQQRGPKCARIFSEHLAKNGATTTFVGQVVILESGFGGWARYVSRLDQETREKVKEHLIEKYEVERHGYRV